jgi:hypothetical protein
VTIPQARFASPVARSKASRSRESDPPSSIDLGSAVHPADYVFAFASRPPGSSPDDPSDTQSPTRPVVPKTTARGGGVDMLPPQPMQSSANSPDMVTSIWHERREACSQTNGGAIVLHRRCDSASNGIQPRLPEASLEHSEEPVHGSFGECAAHQKCRSGDRPEGC